MILSFIKVYNNAKTVFDDNKQVQKIENGYLRFSVLNIY